MYYILVLYIKIYCKSKCIHPKWVWFIQNAKIYDWTTCKLQYEGKFYTSKMIKTYRKIVPIWAICLEIVKRDCANRTENHLTEDGSSQRGDCGTTVAWIQNRASDWRLPAASALKCSIVILAKFASGSVRKRGLDNDWHCGLGAVVSHSCWSLESLQSPTPPLTHTFACASDPTGEKDWAILHMFERRMFSDRIHCCVTLILKSRSSFFHTWATCLLFVFQMDLTGLMAPCAAVTVHLQLSEKIGRC